MEKTDLEFLRKIYKKCDSDNFQCAEDMQYAHEEIREMIEENYPQATKPEMILYCPNDKAVVEYDEVLDIFKCTECEWAGYYYETIKPYEQK
jgi:hypothetical protein